MPSLGTFEQLVLLAVVWGGDQAYGVTVRQVLEEETGRAFSAGAIHTALARLEDRGLVSSRLGSPTPNRSGRPPRFYRIEPVGAQALLDSYSAIQAMAQPVTLKLAQLAEGAP